MRRSAMILAAALTVSASAAAGARAAEPDGLTVYAGVTVIDGTDAAPRPGMAVVVRGERIEAVVPLAQAPAGGRRPDVAGLYVTPGLIDTHVHLATSPDRRAAEAYMRRMLYGGVTAVRDMAGDARALADLSRASRQGEIAAPDVYYSALMAGPDFFKDPRTQAAARGVEPGRAPWMQAITDEVDLPLAVALARGTGASAIKIYADLPGPLTARIVAEAHRQGFRVWAHGMVFPATPAEEVAAGVDVLSHVCMLGYEASDVKPAAYHRRAPVEADRFKDGGNPKVDALFAEMARRGTILDATDHVYVELDQARAADPKAPPPYCTASLAEALTARAYKAGVRIIAGTDGFAPVESAYPALHDEMELLQNKAGMAPLDVIAAATRNGAAAAGQADMGEIAPGKLADLVFVSRDPSRDVAAMRSVMLTVKRGTDYPRKDYRPIAADEVRGFQ